MDSGDRAYRVSGTSSDRWLDHYRLIFWDLDRRKAFLWNTDTGVSHEIVETEEEEGVIVTFVFSMGGDTIYMRRTTVESDIVLLEPSDK